MRFSYTLRRSDGKRPLYVPLVAKRFCVCSCAYKIKFRIIVIFLLREKRFMFTRGISCFPLPFHVRSPSCYLSLHLQMLSSSPADISKSRTWYVWLTLENWDSLGREWARQSLWDRLKGMLNILRRNGRKKKKCLTTLGIKKRLGRGVHRLANK